jgi:hypothetical protein
MENYITTSDKVLDTIKKYGVAIIPSLLDKAEISDMNNGMWDYLEHITSNFTIPISRNDKTTWRSFYELYPMHSMLIQHWGIGHAQHVWDLRQNPKVVDVFAKIWNCKGEDLLTSFDGSSFHFPPEETNRGFFRKSWLHCDQNFSRNNFECVQSWITDINRGLGIENKNDTKKTTECKIQCIDQNFLKQQNSMDKKFLEKTVLDITTGAFCNKRCESIYNHPIVTGKK